MMEDYKMKRNKKIIIIIQVNIRLTNNRVKTKIQVKCFELFNQWLNLED